MPLLEGAGEKKSYCLGEWFLEKCFFSIITFILDKVKGSAQSFLLMCSQYLDPLEVYEEAHMVGVGTPTREQENLLVRAI